MSNITTRLALGLSGALALAATLALASTTSNTPAASCSATSGSLTVAGGGQLQNGTSSTASAVCPIDRTIAPTLSTSVSATVWVIDQSSTQNVCCTLTSTNPLGNPPISSPQVCSSGKSASVQTLSLAQITDTKTFSHYAITCTVPAVDGSASQLLTYRAVQD